MSSTLVVLPTVTLPAAAARPVRPGVVSLALSGIDGGALAGSPAPHTEEEAAAGTPAGAVSPRSSRVRALVQPEAHGDEAHEDDAHADEALAPVAVTGQVTTRAFSAVGVTWARDASVTDVAVQVRTRSGGRWSGWTEVEVQPNATGDANRSEGRAARAGSDPLYVGPSDAVQVRVDAGKAKPRDLKVELIDPGSSPADATVAAGARRTLGASSAHAAEPQPAYVSRAGWGADETLRTCTPSVSSTIKGGILHTTATSNNYTASQSAAIMRSMYAYHTRSLGWCDIGYNFLVDKYGTLFEGRFGGVDKAVIGAHTGGFNSSTVGVSMIGNHDLQTPATAMLTTVQRVFAWKLGLYKLDAQGTTTYTSAGGSATSYKSGTSVTKPVISGHRDYSSKSCPGNYAYPLLPSIRAGVSARMVASAPKIPTTLTLASSPATITYGALTTLRGRLTTADGKGVAGQAVQLFVRRRGTTGWGLLSTRTTGSDGSFSGTHKATSNLDYEARFTAVGQHLASTRLGRVNVAPAVSAALSPSTVVRRARVLLRGTVTPAHPGQLVVRQRLVNGVWRNMSTTRLSATSTYSIPIDTSYPGTKVYRVVRASDADHAWTASAARKLVVR